MEGFKVCDSFTWNLNEQTLSPEKFAEYLCIDMGINPQIFMQQISNSIKSQLADHRRFYQTIDFPVCEDSRVIIKLDIFAGRVHLRDRFEWDISSHETPEEFAEVLVSDLGLGGEFKCLVSHR